MSRIEIVPGFSLYADVEGSGPPLVLLHGFIGSAASWGRFRHLLAERFTTVAVDIVGHGQSDAPSALDHYRMEQAVADLRAAVTALGFERAVWLGYSMGGRTALQVAVAAPAAVTGLVLIGASPGLATQAERYARVRADEGLAERIERDGVGAFVDYWERLPLFATQQRLPEAEQQAIRQGRLANRPGGLANSLRGMGTGAQRSLHDALPDLDLPVLLISGAEDEKYTTIADEMAGHLRRARAVTIADAGHAAHVEAPAACAATITAFYTDCMHVEASP